MGWSGSNTNKTHNISHIKHWNNNLERFDIQPSGGDRCSQLKWNAGYHINRDSFSGEAKHRKPTQFNVYTDGSRYEDQTGFGYVIYKGHRELQAKSFRLPNYATVFQAEIMAIAQAALTMSHWTEDPVHHVKILVDSQAALLALDNPMVKSRTVAGAVEALNALVSTCRSVTLVWVPAHKGHVGNERADALAKKGTELTDPEHLLRVGKPAATIKAELRSCIMKDWQQEWDHCGQAHHTKGFFFGPHPQKSKYIYKLARLELGRFVRVVTGHNNLNFFQAKIGLTSLEKCRFCGDGNETITHFITKCPRLLRASREFFQDCPPCNDMKWSVRDILHFSFIPGVNEAYEGSWAHGDPITLSLIHI